MGIVVFDGIIQFQLWASENSQFLKGQGLKSPAGIAQIHRNRLTTQAGKQVLIIPQLLNAQWIMNQSQVWSLSNFSGGG